MGSLNSLYIFIPNDKDFTTVMSWKFIKLHYHYYFTEVIKTNDFISNILIYSLYTYDPLAAHLISPCRK